MLYQGIVIKKTDNGEYNQLVSLYTKDFGKITAVAKSIKKPSSKQAAHLDVLNLVDFLLVFGKNYPIITSAQSVETFAGIKSSLPKSATALFVLEAFNNLIYDHEKDPALWNFALNFMKRLEDGVLNFSDVKDCLIGIQKELVNFLGYSQEIKDEDMNRLLDSLSLRKFLSPELISQFSYIADLE
ncbi:MAG: DNA repair protein RecO [Candidatus Yanofskybacteria bacterium]|nr:DNA repair protein RecO [Candidatus Yanofskybacteria bacterium]